MTRSEFKQLLTSFLLTLVPGTTLGGSRGCKSSHALTAFEHPCSILLKPFQDATYRIQLRRSQRFSPDEKRLIQCFSKELSQIIPYAEKPFFSDLVTSLPPRIIASFLARAPAYEALKQAIQKMESLASQTYEGHPIVLAVGITGRVTHPPVTFDELWEEDFSRVLSNGFDTMYIAGSKGGVFQITALPISSVVSYAPYRFGAVAKWANKANRIALLLNRNGEILIFKDQLLQFAKRRGVWRYYPHQSVISRLGKGLPREVKEAVYQTCLDVSFARTGGCIAVISPTSKTRLAKSMKGDDLLTDNRKAKSRLLRSSLMKKFQNLDRRVRQELAAIDGATVLWRDGTVLVVGAIIKLPGGSTGGGRKAAAMQLSKLGIGIKISSDGPAAGYRYLKESFKF